MESNLLKELAKRTVGQIERIGEVRHILTYTTDELAERKSE